LLDLLRDLFRSRRDLLVAKVISVRSPWQNCYRVRVVGSLKRECLNHVIVFGKHHAKRRRLGLGTTVYSQDRSVRKLLIAETNS